MLKTISLHDLATAVVECPEALGLLPPSELTPHERAATFYEEAFVSGWLAREAPALYTRMLDAVMADHDRVDYRSDELYDLEQHCAPLGGDRAATAVRILCLALSAREADATEFPSIAWSQAQGLGSHEHPLRQETVQRIAKSVRKIFESRG